MSKFSLTQERLNSINCYSTKEAALNAAVSWVQSIRLDLHKEFTCHG